MPDDHMKDGTTQDRKSPREEASEPSEVSGPNRTDLHIEQLVSAALSSSPNACQTAVAKFLALGISPERIADAYVPEAARKLGESWCSDEIGFANVTIGSSRLQMVLRELGKVWIGNDVAAACAPTILLIVGNDIHHTLGASVLAGQLRRKGISVRLMLNATPAEAADQARRGCYDSIFISASCGEKVENLRKIVDSIKQDLDAAAPIVIGGTILTEVKDVRMRTGADYVTNDPDEALTLCGLKKKRNHLMPIGRDR